MGFAMFSTRLRFDAPLWMEHSRLFEASAESRDAWDQLMGRTGPFEMSDWQ
jgi:hypothetical protein